MPKKDEFSQIGYISVAQSAANVLTFGGMTIMTSFLASSAMILHQVEYQLTASDYALMTTAGDLITVGLSGSNSMTAVALSDPEVYDRRTQVRNDWGVAASGGLETGPVITDFTNLPGGGVLVPADRIYGYVDSNGLAAAIGVEFRFRFTVLELTSVQYLELAQALRVLR